MLGACSPSTTDPAAAERASADRWDDPDRPPPGADLDDLQALGYVDHDTATRRVEGVTVFDRVQSQPGFNLYADDRSRVYLLDLEGQRVHEWRLTDHDQCETAELLPGGDLLALSVDQGIIRLSRDSEVRWQVALNAHHDLAVLADGSVLVLVWEESLYRGRRVRFDRIVRVTPDGRSATHWSSLDALATLQPLHPPLPLDTEPPGPLGNPEAASAEIRPAESVYDYYHLNSLEVLPDNELGRTDARFRAGNLLVSSRNASLIFILADGEIVWHFRPGTLDFPHMPTWTAENTILVFDNGWHRGHSRVLEIDPRTKKEVWRYPAGPADFFTKKRGSNQRLPNGNTLICESDRGRVFEVDREGELVWEFWNPLESGAKRRRIYRFLRFPEEEILAWLPRPATGESRPR